MKRVCHHCRPHLLYGEVQKSHYYVQVVQCEPSGEKALEMATLERKQMLILCFVLDFIFLCCMFNWYCEVGIQFLTQPYSQ